MPVKNGIGYSSYTPIKGKLYSDLVEKELGAIRGIFLKYGKSDWKRNTVLIIDSTAGCGYHKVNDSLFPEIYKGSPFIVLDKIIKPIYSKINFKFICIEVDESNYQKLENIKSEYALPENVDFEIINGDSAIVLDKIYKKEQIGNSKKWQYGWVYNDPSGNVPIFDYVKTLSKLRQFTPLDYIINIPTTTLLRVSCAPQCHENRRLTDYLDELNKNFWWVNDTPHGRHKWAMAYGTNWAGIHFGHIGVNGKYRFKRTDTETGKQVLHALSTTRQEREAYHGVE